MDVNIVCTFRHRYVPLPGPGQKFIFQFHRDYNRTSRWPFILLVLPPKTPQSEAFHFTLPRHHLTRGPLGRWEKDETLAIPSHKEKSVTHSPTFQIRLFCYRCRERTSIKIFCKKDSWGGAWVGGYVRGWVRGWGRELDKRRRECAATTSRRSLGCLVGNLTLFTAISGMRQRRVSEKWKSSRH